MIWEFVQILWKWIKRPPLCFGNNLIDILFFYSSELDVDVNIQIKLINFDVIKIKCIEEIILLIISINSNLYYLKKNKLQNTYNNSLIWKTENSHSCELLSYTLLLIEYMNLFNKILSLAGGNCLNHLAWRTFLTLCLKSVYFRVILHGLDL